MRFILRLSSSEHKPPTHTIPVTKLQATKSLERPREIWRHTIKTWVRCRAGLSTPFYNCEKVSFSISFQKHKSMKSVRERTILAVGKAKYGPIGTNQNLAFHHGPVQLCNTEKEVPTVLIQLNVRRAICCNCSLYFVVISTLSCCLQFNLVY